MKSTIKTHLTILLLAGIGGSLHAQQAPPPKADTTANKAISVVFMPATLRRTGSGVNAVGGGWRSGLNERCAYFFITRPECCAFCPGLGVGGQCGVPFHFRHTHLPAQAVMFIHHPPDFFC